MCWLRKISVASHAPNRLDAIVSKLWLLVLPCIQAKTGSVIVKHCRGSVVLIVNHFLHSEASTTSWHRQGRIIVNGALAEAHVRSRCLQAACNPLSLFQDMQILHARKYRV